MDALPLKPETAAKLEELARLRGSDPIEFANQAFGDWLTEEHEEYEATCKAVERGYADVEAGRTRPAATVLSDLCRKHDISR